MISHNLPIGNPQEPIKDFDETEFTGNVDLGPPKVIQMSDAKPYYIKGNLVKPMDETNLNKLNEALRKCDIHHHSIFTLSSVLQSGTRLRSLFLPDHQKMKVSLSALS